MSDVSRGIPDLNPFPGLRPFRQDEDYLFFGREEQTMELLQRLGSHRFVAVVGTSGSGKSSLVRCGLLSELLGGKMLQAGASWEVAVTHPGGNPLALLAEALLDADLYDSEADHARENLLATLSRSHFGLVEAVRQAGLGDDTNFLLVVDQFEEIFRFHEAGQTQRDMASEFVSILLEAAGQKEVPIYIVLTMRSDFIGECGQFEGLAEMVNRGEFLIPRLTREQYKRVIEGPIKVAGGQITPRLLQRLLNDLGQQADQLPCLQHALMRTWDLWSQHGDAEALDLDDYQRVGRMAQALSLHADEVYESLATDRQRELCKGLFQALTVQESDNRGIRRPQRLAGLCAILEISADELEPVIDAYRQHGVTFLMPPPEVELTERTVIDISHESLMRVWTRLRHWVEEEAQAAGIYRRLSESATLYEHGKAGLYRDPELGIALAWRETQRPNRAWAERYGAGFEKAIEYLQASHRASLAEAEAREAARQRELEQARQLAEVQQQRLDQQKRSAQKLRKMLAGLALVALIAGVACIAALIANNRANTLARVASQNEQTALESAADAERQRQGAEAARQETEQALIEVEREKDRAQQNQAKAERAEQQSRELLYATDMELASIIWHDQQATASQALRRLAAHDPAVAEASLEPGNDLRGFEWYYQKHLFENTARVFSNGDRTIADGTLTADGQLVSLDEKVTVRRWELRTVKGDAESQEPQTLSRGRLVDRQVLAPNGRLAALVVGRQVHVVDAETGEDVISPLPDRSRGGLMFSPDSRMLVTVDSAIHWWDVSTGRPLGTRDDSGWGNVLSLSADGLTLAVGRQGNTGSEFSIFRLNPETAEVELLKNTEFAGSMRTLALRPDGRVVAVSSYFSGRVVLYDTSTADILAENSSEHASSVSAIAFDSPGAEMATASLDGTIKVWTDLEELQSADTTLKGHLDSVTRVLFSPHGSELVSVGEDKTLRVWDRDRMGVAQVLEGELTRAFRSQYSPDGLLIAVADLGNRLHLWDATSGRRVCTLPAGSDDEDGRIFSVAFSPDGRLVAAGFGGTQSISHVAVWNIDSGERVVQLAGATDLPDFELDRYSSAVSDLAFSPDGRHLVASFGAPYYMRPPGPKSPLKVWDVATWQLLHRLEGHTGYCVSVTFSKDGSRLASGSRDGSARVWDTSTWTTVHTLQNPDAATLTGRRMVGEVQFSPDGKVLAMASREGNVIVWDAETGQRLQTLEGHANAVLAVAFSPDGRTLATGAEDQTVRLWNRATWRELIRLDAGSLGVTPNCLCFSPDGRRLLAAGEKAVCWRTSPAVWQDPELAADRLATLRDSSLEFSSRIRMLSENLGLHAALEVLSRRRPDDQVVQSALAAAQANWHASQHAWPQAVDAFDRLVTAVPDAPEAWLRTPALLRIARALLEQDRPAAAVALLVGGADRRTRDGLEPVTRHSGLGLKYTVEAGTVRVTEILPESPAAAQGSLRPDDLILQVNDRQLNAKTLPELDLGKLFGADAGTVVRLRVQHSDADELEDIEIVTARHFVDDGTGESLRSLFAAINGRLEREPQNAALLELRGVLAGMWSDHEAQVADYSEAIGLVNAAAVPTSSAPGGPADDARRLYRLRGDAYAALAQWRRAYADYQLIGDDSTVDDALLERQTRAQAEMLFDQLDTDWTILEPVEYSSAAGAELERLPDQSLLVSGERATPETYTVSSQLSSSTTIAALRLEALTHPSLPGSGPGRSGQGPGNFVLTELTLDVRPPGETDGERRVAFHEAVGTWSQTYYAFDTVIDGKYGTGSRTGWAIGPRWGRSQAICLILAEPLQVPAGSQLTVRLSHNYESETHGLGCFRVAVAENRTAVDIERLEKLLAVRDLRNPWAKLAAVHRFAGRFEAIDELVARHPAAATQIGELFAADGQWAEAVQVYDRAIAAGDAEAVVFAGRARAYEELGKYQKAAADWERVAEMSPSDRGQLTHFIKRLATSEQADLRDTQLEHARQLHEAALVVHPRSDVIASELAGLLIAASGPRWTVLEPSRMESTGGATLERLDNGSILVSGKKPDRDVFEIEAEVDAGALRSIRLEGLRHESLPQGRPGRAGNGNVVLTEFEAEVFDPDTNSWRSVTFTDAWADYEQSDGDWKVSNAIDGSRDTGWAIGATYKPGDRLAIFRTATPFAEGRTRLRIRLKHESQYPQRHFGCFRLSVSADRGLHHAVQNPRLKLAGVYAEVGDVKQSARLFSGLLAAAQTAEVKNEVVEHLQHFDRAIAELIRMDPLNPYWQLANARNRVAQARQYVASGKLEQAQAAFEKGRRTCETLLARESRPQWTILAPAEMESEIGAVLTLRDDGSILVEGRNADSDTLTLTAELPDQPLAGVRLETLPDARLNWGAGRSDHGGFAVNELACFVETESSGNARMLSIQDGFATQSHADHTAGQAFDFDSSTYWSVGEGRYQPQSIYLQLGPSQLSTGGSRQLTVRIASGSDSVPLQTLGRFRLSVTADREALQLAQLQQRIDGPELATLNLDLGKAYAQDGKHTEAAEAFARAWGGMETRERKRECLEQVTDFPEVLPLLVHLRPDEPLFRLALARQLAADGRRRLREQDSAAAVRDLAEARRLLETLLADYPEPTWHVLRADQMQTDSETRLQLEDDGSVFAQDCPGMETYTLVFPLELPGMTALRLEALADPRLPAGGPGATSDGNFVLSEFTARLVPQAQPDKPQVIGLQNAQADFSQDGWHVSEAVDGDLSNGWAIRPQFNQDHVAFFETIAEEADDGLAELHIQLKQLHDAGKHQLGRFRISVTNDAIERVRASQFRMELATDERAQLDSSLAASYALGGQLESAVHAYERAFRAAPDAATQDAVIQSAAEHHEVLERLVETSATEPRFCGALCRFYAASGQFDKMGETAARARALYEEQLHSTADESAASRYAASQVAGQLAELLLATQSIQWTVLEPQQMTSTGGAALSKLPNHAILAGGPNPPSDEYLVEFAVPAAMTVHAVRLEALTHETLPGNGPGRSTYRSEGVFTISRWHLSVRTEDVARQTPLTFRKGVADHSMNDAGVDTQGHWNITHGQGSDHTAVWILEQPVTVDAGGTVVSQMQFQPSSEWADQNLGCFRVSICSSPSALEALQFQERVEKIADSWTRLGVAYGLAGQDARAVSAFAQSLARARDDAGIVDIAKEAARFETVFEELISVSPHAELLSLGRAQYLGPKLVAAEQYAEAVEVLSAALQEFPEDRTLLELRAEASVAAKRYQLAVADLSQLIAVATDVSARRELERKRAEACVHCRRWEQAAETYTQEMLYSPSWSTARDACVTHLMAGNLDAAKVAATTLFNQLGDELPSYQAAYLARIFAALPGLVSDENVEKLTKAAAKVGGSWKDPMTAAFHYRLGDLQKAQTLLTTSADKPDYLSLTAMMLHEQGKSDEALDFLQQAADWFEDQRMREPGAAVPSHHAWQNWLIWLAMYRDAARALAGPRLTELDEALQQDSDNVQLLHARAELLQRYGLLEDALVDLNRALSLSGESAALLGWRGRVFAKLRMADEAFADLTRAIELGSNAPRVFAVRGGLLDERGQTEQARRDLERSLELEPTDVAAAALADLLLADTSRRVDWKVLEPESMSSTGGAVFTVQKDGSLFVSGRNIDADDYTLKASIPVDSICGLRLECLPDSRLPGNGSGRASNGNFRLGEIDVTLQPPGRGEPVPLAIENAFSDFTSGAGNQVQNAWDGNPASYWNHWPDRIRAHEAVFQLVSIPVQGPLIVQLHFAEGGVDGLNLGRFRISILEHRDRFEQEVIRLKAVTLTDPWLRLATAYALDGQVDAASDTFRKAFTEELDPEDGRRVVEFLAHFDSVRERLIEALPGRALLKLAAIRSLALKGTQAVAESRYDEALKHLDTARQSYQELLPADAWRVLEPVEMRTKLGGALELQDDGSIFVREPAENDTYVLECRTDLQRICALRLEALVDSRLPSGGPGWSGNFVLNELTLHTRRGDQDNVSNAVTLGNATADFNQPGWHVSGTIDGDTATGWAIWPKPGHDHTALFEADVDIDAGQPVSLVISLEHHSRYDRHWLGRFRIAVTDRPDAYRAERARLLLPSRTLVDLTAARGIACWHLDRKKEAFEAFGDAAGYTQSLDDQMTLVAAVAGLEGMLQRLVESNPDLREAAFQQSVRREDWAEAARYGWMRVEADPDSSYSWLRLSPIVALEGDAAYRNFCQRAMAQFAQTQDFQTVEQLCKACLMRPDGLDPAAIPAATLVDALEKRSVPAGLISWSWLARSLLEHRKGNSRIALQYAEKVFEHDPREMTQALTLCVRALAHQQLGETELAMKAMEQAAKIIGQRSATGSNDHDLLIVQVLLQEARDKQSGHP